MQDIIEDIRAFNRERDWGKFHSPKNLSMALIVEAAELVEIFQWLTEEQSRSLDPQKKIAAEEEIGDIVIYLLNIADHLGVDILEAAKKKLRKNLANYPVERARGRAAKHDALAQEAGSS
jgi:NTP pyrophosphatase (non-canonical NTP hydrolase)